MRCNRHPLPRSSPPPRKRRRSSGFWCDGLWNRCRVELHSSNEHALLEMSQKIESSDGTSPVIWRRDGPVLLFAALYPTLGTWLYFHTFAGHESLKFVYTASKVLQFLLPVVWVWFVQR